MAIIECKCPSCGASIKVDDLDDAAICQYCGRPFIVEKAIHTYIKNQTNNTINNYISKQDNQYTKSKLWAIAGILFGIVCILLVIGALLA